jgi:hypothetical protein
MTQITFHTHNLSLYTTFQKSMDKKVIKKGILELFTLCD